MSNSNYEQRYKVTVVDFFNGRTHYDTENTIGRALPLLDLVPLSEGLRVLDIATGTGIIAITAAQQVGPEGTVVGIDFSSGMLAQGQQKIDELNLQNIELIEADVEKVGFDADSFDAVICSSALVYLADVSDALRKWHHWLKPGGWVAFSAWSEQSYATPLIIEVCSRRGIELLNINAPTGSVEKCFSLLESAGFQNLQVKRENSGYYAPLEIARRWDGSWFHPTANPLETLSEAMMKTLTTDYAAAIEKRATEQGVWVEREAFYLSGQKPLS